MKAHTQVVTRCFGTPTEIMVVPFADCANHHVTDNEFHVLNVRLTKLAVEAEKTKQEPECTKEESKYFSKERNRIKVMKNFTEDMTHEELKELPYKSLRYSKKLKYRHAFEKMAAEEFRKNPEY